MTDSDHRELLETLASLKGQFLISTYPNPIYRQWDAQNGFNLHEKVIDNKASSAKAKAMKRELVYCNFYGGGEMC